MHATRVELDDSLLVRESAEANGRVLRVELLDHDALDRGVERVSPLPH
jgi:hypothetical protein